MKDLYKSKFKQIEKNQNQPNIFSKHPAHVVKDATSWSKLTCFMFDPIWSYGGKPFLECFC